MVIPILKFAKVLSTSILNIMLWHHRLAHLSLDNVKLLIRSDLVDGLTIKSSERPNTICEPCLTGKQHRNPFPTSMTRASKPLALIHTNLHGPMLTHTHSGH